MKKNLFFFLFCAIFIAVYSQEENTPYSIQFRGPYGASVNSGKSYFYVNPSTNNLRIDGALPASKEHSDYPNYEWYFVPVSRDEPGWYYIINGTGKYLMNDKSMIRVGDLTEDEIFKWRLFKVSMHQIYEPEHSFRLVQSVGGKPCHIIRSSNSLATTANSFTSSQNTLLIKPSRQYNLYNQDMELITNYEQYKLNSSILLDPSFFLEDDPDRTIMDEYYFPANFKRQENSKASLMFNYSDEEVLKDTYFIRLGKNDGIQTTFLHPQEGDVFYKISMKIRSSQKIIPPAGIRFLDNKDKKYIEKPLYVKETDDWYIFQTYVELTEYSSDLLIDIYATLTDNQGYVDIDNITVEEIDHLPFSEIPFLPGEYKEGKALYDYPYENPGFTYTIREDQESINENCFIFIPFHFFEEVSDIQISFDRINRSIMESKSLKNFSISEEGIFLQEKDFFIPGNEYGLTISGTWNEKIYTQKVNLKVAPEKVFWNPVDGYNAASWNEDNNWKDEYGNPSFVPMKNTSVILAENQFQYPSLNSLENELSQISFIQYDYNYLPNVCDTIVFMNGSELGNPFFLDYENAKIEWEVNTMQWYNISPPLKNMYSGDFLFDRLNPLSELQLHNTINPQTGFYSSAWTHSFNNTNVPLNPGSGYSLRVGSLYYDRVDDQGADYSSKSIIEKIKYQFPNKQFCFRFFDEITKIPYNKVEYISEEGRQFSSRFIYETIEEDKYFPSQQDVLLEIDTEIKTGEATVVVGNPFMSHFDFSAFYFYNKELIYPQYKILNQQGEYISVLGIDKDLDGLVESYVFSDNYSTESLIIGPMESFVVTTKESYSGQPLIVDKSMSCIASKAKGILNREEQILSIRLEDYNARVSEIFLYDNGNGLDNINSRKMIYENTDERSNLFFVSEEAFFDIGILYSEADNINLGVISPKNNQNELVIENLSLFPNDYYFYDAETQTKISFNGKERISYSFLNTEGFIYDRFSIRKDYSSSCLSEKTKWKPITMNCYNNKVIISSDLNDPIKKIAVKTIDGITRYQLNNIDRILFEIPYNLPENTICMIIVETENNFKTFKTLIK